jgi:hypothetical protein
LLLLGVSALDLCSLWCFLVFWLHVVYHKYASMIHHINAMHEVQRVIYYMIMHHLTILPLSSHLLNYP